MSPGLDAYLLCATARSGSTLLCSLLGCSGVAGHPESYFIRRGLDEYAERWGLVRPDDGSIDDAYLRAALAASRTANGVGGLRVMAETMPELINDLSSGSDCGTTDLDLLTAHFGRLRFVHLRRDDVVGQAVSWARSLQTHYWHPGEVMVPGGQQPRYDESMISELVTRIGELEAFWSGWFGDQGIVALEVTYEQLAADPAGTAAGVLDFLGLELPPGRTLTAKDRRQADQLNADWARRYRSGRARVRPETS